MRIATILLTLLLPPLLLAADRTEVLSTQKETKDSDPPTAAQSKNESTAFWGVSNMMGGSKRHDQSSTLDTVEALRQYAKRPGDPYSAAFAVMIGKRGEVLEKLATSKSPSDTQIAAAALALGAIADHRQAWRDENIPQPAREEKAGKGRGKGKGKGKGKNAKGGKAFGGSQHLSALLASKDSKTVYFAVQAAAYGKVGGVSDQIAELKAQDGKIAAAKLLYRVMNGEDVSMGEIKSVAQKAASGKSSRNSAPSFDIDVHGLCLVAQACAERGSEDAMPVLVTALKFKDERVQIDAARAMRDIGSEAALPHLFAAIQNASWPVLIEVCAATGAIPSTKMIPALVKRLAEEEGRMQCDLVHTLSCIAGGQKGQNAKEWAAWWAKNKRTFKVDEEASEAYRSATRPSDVNIPGTGYFYGLPIFSDRFSYVVDSSASMKGDRIASLKPNLTESIDRLASHVRYCVVDFGGDVEALYGAGLTTNKNMGKQRVYDMDLSVATRSFCAMRQGMIIDGLDTIYFLSDGAPAMDSMRTWSDITTGVLLLTRYRQVAVFCIDFDPSAGNQASMMRLADHNVGLHESIEVGPAGDVDVGGAAKRNKKKK
jgi:hypothetical protein